MNSLLSKLQISKLQSTSVKTLAPVFFFFAGVTYDSLTLTRIDRVFDNLVLLLYVSLLGTLIILTGRAQMGALPKPVSTTEWNVVNFLHKTQPYYVMALQFLFGGLFSAYAIVYAQSASLDSSAVFLVIIVIMLVANEFLRNRLSSLTLLVSLYALVTFSFFTFFLPVVTGWMNTAVFLLGALISIGVVIRVVQLTYRHLPQVPQSAPLKTTVPAIALICLFVGFYFLNWIPPVPLSLKFGGMYHQVTKHHEMFELTYEKGPWYRFWKDSDNPFIGEGPIYCFTAVFAPVNLDLTIYHHWQYRPPSSDSEEVPFMTTDKIPIKISGGREQGYRSYSVKQRVMPGEWQVSVETEEGKRIGRVHFKVKPKPEEDYSPEMATRTY